MSKTRKSKSKHYDVHDNGGRPFRVFIDGLKVSIYKDINKDWEKPADYSKLIKALTVKEVHVGKSTGLADNAVHRPSEAKHFIGNSLLLQLSGNKYIYIGSEIYEFTMEDKYESYFSMIGRNDVPYPVILGSENVYFMLYKCYVPRSNFPAIKTKVQWENAYAYFYGSINAETGEDVPYENVLKKKFSPEKNSKKMKGLKAIQKRS